MACLPQTFFKFTIYLSIALVLASGITLETAFVKLASGKFAEATDNKSTLLVIGTLLSLTLLALAILGICGVYKHSGLMLIIYAGVMAALFICFWLIFAYMKGGKGLL